MILLACLGYKWSIWSQRRERGREVKDWEWGNQLGAAVSHNPGGERDRGQVDGLTPSHTHTHTQHGREGRGSLV